jgi:hypothetical protein
MTTSAEPIGVSHRATSRLDRLAEQVGRLRTRGTGNTERWMLIVGGTLMPLGLLAILLGWVGASHTPLPFEQTSYLISGGLLGLGLVVSGGFVYFAYWQTVRIRESREQHRQLVEAVGRLEARLVATEVAAGADTAVTSGLVATASGTMFHRADCPIVAGRDDLAPIDPDDTNLRPCKMCDPLPA